MKKAIIIAIIMSALLLAGCTPVDYAMPEIINNAPTTMPKVTKAPTTPIEALMGTPEGSFGVFNSLTINDYVAGVRVDKSIKGYEPLYIINRVNKVSEKKIIQTEPGETIADIPIRRILHDEDISNVLSITSDYEGENLVAEKYNEDRTITVSGFVPNEKRTAVFTYIPDSQYNVSIKIDNRTEYGYSAAPIDIIEWVEFDSDTILAEPDSWKPIWINIFIPESEIILPQHLYQITNSGEIKLEYYRALIAKLMNKYEDGNIKALEQLERDIREANDIIHTKEYILLDKLEGMNYTNDEIYEIVSDKKIINDMQEDGYILLTNDKKWQFFVVVTLSSGTKTPGVSTEIEYMVGIKVIMG